MQNEVKKYTTFKIGGEAKGLYFPKTTDELGALLKKLPKPLVLGNGSNVLVSSEGVKEDVNMDISNSSYLLPVLSLNFLLLPEMKFPKFLKKMKK